jgi:hypothetical protein
MALRTPRLGQCARGDGDDGGPPDRVAVVVGAARKAPPNKCVYDHLFVAHRLPVCLQAPQINLESWIG